jgi:hypothetical protein
LDKKRQRARVAAEFERRLDDVAELLDRAQAVEKLLRHKLPLEASGGGGGGRTTSSRTHSSRRLRGAAKMTHAMAELGSVKF